MLSVLIAGLFPLGMLFFELRFILRLIWEEHICYSFGILLLYFLALYIVSAEMAVIFTYFQLINEVSDVEDL